MGTEAVIGALRVVLSADNDNFEASMDSARSKVGQLETAIGDMSTKLAAAGQKVVGVAATITTALGLAQTAISVSSTHAAADFETAMKRVQRALDNVTPEQLKALEGQATTMGQSVGRGAGEAAGAIEELAKSGMSASEIMGGAFAASLKLAAIGNADLAPAAQLTNGIMQTFGKTANDLGPVVDRVAGALRAGHGGFDAYKSAVSDAGDQAVRAGISFDDFNTVIAANGSVMHKGETAGSSFKSFLSSLADSSKQAKKEMKDLGVSFVDSTGQMKPLSDVAGILQKTMTGLSEKARTKVFTDMFGADGMTTGLALMKLGQQGYLDLQATIAKTDGTKEAAAAQEGYAAAVKRLGASFENLKIAIGQSGLLDWATRFVDMLARIVERVSGVGPALAKMGGAFAFVAAAAGPVLAVIGGALYFAFGYFLRHLGEAGSALRVFGWGVSAIIEPIGTLVAAFIQLGLRLTGNLGLRAVAGMFLDLAGPIGWAITAVIMFKDYIVPALKQVWDMAVTTLGPPLEALLAKVGALFTGLSTGPIGTAVGVIIDVLGVLVAFVVEAFGGAFVEALGIIVGVLSTLVSMVQDVVTLVSDLLHGDFAGAWAAAQQFVADAVQGIVDIVKGLFPGAAQAIQVFYEAAKSYLVEGVGGVFTWLGGMAEWLVGSIGSTFPRIIEIAKSVYEGIKTWLVDNLGPVGEWIASWAGNVVARFNDTKRQLGLGGAPAAPKPVAPPATPKPTGKPKVTNNYMPSNDKDDDGKDKKEKHGPTAEDLRLQKEIEADQLRGDLAEAQALQDRLDLNKQIEAYQRTGLGLADARTRAERDMKEIQAARAASQARAIGDEQRSNEITVAQLGHHYQTEISLQRQAELEKLILFYKQQGKLQPEAEAAAAAEQSRLEEAREAARKKWVSDDADARAVRLAQLRGDSDKEIADLQRVIDVKKRADEIEKNSNGMVSHEDAMGQANKEADQDKQAEMQGKFRDIFRGGFKAALDGDIGSWFQSWWKDRVQKGMEQALNSLADLISSLFSKLGSSDASTGGGGLFGSIGKAIGGLFGKSSNTPSIDTSSWGAAGSAPLLNIDTAGMLPGFATGGGFTVGGKSGIDQNVVSMRLTKGEMVDIRKPGNDNGAGGITVHAPLYLTGAVDLATKDYANNVAQAHAAAVKAGIADASRRAPGR